MVFNNKVLLINQVKSLISQWTEGAKFDLSMNKSNGAIESEEFFREFLSKIYDIEYINSNKNKQNNPGYDLIDIANKRLVQISYEFTIDKVKSTLKTLNISKWESYEILFFFPTKEELENIKKHKGYDVSISLTFDPIKNVINLNDLYKALEYLDFMKIKELHTFVSSYLTHLIDPLSILNKNEDLRKIVVLLNSHKIEKIGGE